MLNLKNELTNNAFLGLMSTSIHTQFRPHFGMFFKTQLLETSKGRDLGLFFDRLYFLNSHLLPFT